MSDNSPDDSVLKKQASIIRMLFRFLPAPRIEEDAGPEQPTPTIVPDRTQAYWTALSRRSGDLQLIELPEGVVDLLSSTFALRPSALVGGPSYAEATSNTYDDTLGGYQLSVEWTNSLVRIYWNTEREAPAPDVVVIEDLSSTVVLAVATPGLPSGTLVLDQNALKKASPRFSPATSKWRVTLLGVRR